MPTSLDFESTKKFRDFLIEKTLKNPNGPQTFTKDSYSYSSPTILSNVDPGDVVDNVYSKRKDILKKYSGLNLYNPVDGYVGLDRIINVVGLGDGTLKLYPNFNVNIPRRTLVSILSNENYENESKLFKFAANYIKNDPNGPILSRVNQNYETTVNGKNRLLDALNGNTGTALNLFTGRESLIEFNNKITVSKTIPGKVNDFLETISGITPPFSEIPGDYLTNPLRTVVNRPEAKPEFGKFIQDSTGAIGSMMGIQRRPLESRKPSDLLLEYTGQGQKQALYDLLSYSKYAPNYSTTARSQNTSKIFTEGDSIKEGVNNLFGLDAPKGISYIGDDRGNDFKYATIDFNDRVVRGNYYTTLMFDPIAAKLFHLDKSTSDGGSLDGNLTWVSRNSKNKLGSNDISKSKSTNPNHQFRESSILGITQELLNTLPTDGGASRSHVANVIDQTSKFFKEGDLKISKGSAIKYVDKFNNEESGMEYCRVWTKDQPYSKLSDTMKRTPNIRKFDSSVMGGQSRVWNLNIGPMSNGKKSFDSSTNISSNWKFGEGSYAKKYMFSIENLAWKTSDTNGFRVSDLPVSERGPNGGRVMWFPPYDLKVNDTNTAKWDENSFLGRPEPIYTYQNTTRSSTISFKVVVDHPSILNLLVREHFKGMSNEESDNYINAFFAGCKDIDFYDLVQTYTTLTPDDVTLITEFLNSGKESASQKIPTYKYLNESTVTENPSVTTKTDSSENVKNNFTLLFDNAEPRRALNDLKNTEATSDYSQLYDNYIKLEASYTQSLTSGLTTILTGGNSVGPHPASDRNIIFGTETPISENLNNLINIQTGMITKGFSDMEISYNNLKTSITQLKSDIETNGVTDISFTIETSSSEVGKTSDNLFLGVRRANSILKDLIKKISSNNVTPNIKWYSTSDILVYDKKGETPLLTLGTYNLKDFGYSQNGKVTFKIKSTGEVANVGAIGKCGQKIHNDSLKKSAPVAFFCRQGTVKMEYTKKGKTAEVTIVPQNIPNTVVQPEETIIKGKVGKKPNINVMQRIIAKTLSEEFYFKKLEDDSPLIFNSLVEKLKYFHPAFHSTTPEGLNSRLTFLLQCLRPGDTIPVKSNNNNDLDENARNTTFGPPPICVLRIGDFYHSKMVVRNVDITYEDGVWDLNPEGIGIQPMIAGVTLQVSLIGGQGLDKPVDRLQNALSSNFFANTEMYDERAKITSTINGKDEDKFTKEFLEQLQNKPQNILVSQTDESKSKNYILGTYIGGNGETLRYSSVVDTLFRQIIDYIKSYSSTFNYILTNYGTYFTGLFFSSYYRPINRFRLEVDEGDTVDTVDYTFVGEFVGNEDLSYLIKMFLNSVEPLFKDDNLNLINVLDLNVYFINEGNTESINLKLKDYILQKLTETLNNLICSSQLIQLIEVRDRLIKTMDEINFLTKYGYDCAIIEDKTYKGTLTGFDTVLFHGEFNNILNYLEDKHNLIDGRIDNTIDFTAPSINETLLIQILKVFLQKETDNIVSLITDEISLYDDQKYQLNTLIKNFISIPSVIDFKTDKPPIRKNDKPLEYTMTSTEITDPSTITEVLQLWGKKNKVGNRLNYFRK